MAAKLTAKESPDISLPVIKTDIENIAPVLRTRHRAAGCSIGVQSSKVDFADREEFATATVGQGTFDDSRHADALRNCDDRIGPSIALAESHLNLERLVGVA